MGKFVKYTDKVGEWRFHLKAGNGEKILHSEGYKTQASCDNGIASVRKNSQDEGRFVNISSRNGQHYFVLKAANGQIIGTSEMYRTTSGRNKGKASVKANAAMAKVEKQ